MKVESPTLTLGLDKETAERSEVDTSEKADVIMEETSKETHNLTGTDLSHKNADYYNQKAEGLKKFLHGVTYQLGLLTLIAYRAQKAKKKFYLISEAAGFGKFDDLVVDYGDRITFLQAKHSAEQANYEKKDFLAAPNANENQASLAKYFDSWMLLKNSDYCKTKDGKAKESQFIFFTNKGVKEGSDFLEEKKISKDGFLFEDLEQKTFKFKSEESRKEFAEAIYYYSERTKHDTTKLTNYESQHIKEARDFLEKKLAKLKPSASPINITRRSQLDFKAIAIIKLALQNTDMRNELCKDNKGLEKLLAANSSKIKIAKKVDVDASKALSCVLDESKELVNQFLDKLIIKVEQPNTNALAKAIQTEIIKDATIAGGELYSYFSNYMLKWFSDRHNCVLEFDGISKFIKATKGDLQRFYLLAGTKAYIEDMTYTDGHKGAKIDWSKLGTVEKLGTFLNSKEQIAQIFYVIDKGGGAKPQVYNTINSIAGFKVGKHHDQWAFLKLDDGNIEVLPEVLLGETTRFAVIDCRATAIEEEEIDSLQKVIDSCNKNKKKLILLLKDGQKELVIEKLPLLSELRSDESIIESLANNTIKTLCKVYEDRYVSLAGKYYKIKEVVEEESVLKAISNTENLREFIGSASDKFEEVKSELPYGIYIENGIKKGIDIYDLSMIKTRAAKYYIIEGAKEIDLKDELDALLPKKDSENKDSEYFTQSGSGSPGRIEYVGHKNSNKKAKPTGNAFVLITDSQYIEKYDAKENFTIILSKKPENMAGKQYIWLEWLEGTKLKHIEHSKNISLPFPDDITFEEALEQKEVVPNMQSDGKLSVLMAKAGLGKTSFCQNLVTVHNKPTTPAESIAMKPKLLWVVKVFLPDLRFDNTGKPELQPFAQAIYTWQSEAYKNACEKKNKVLLVLDSFDEVKVKAQVEQINNWIRDIEKGVAVIITTREYAANKLQLPDSKNITLYQLNEYTPGQQKDYIKQYINEIIKDVSEKEDVIKLSSQSKKIANVILKKVQSTKFSKVLGIPLESYLFCELLKPYIVNSYEKSKEVGGVSIEEAIKSSLLELNLGNIADLYQKFILSKSALYLNKHLGTDLNYITKENIIFNLMGAANRVIELYALKQMFALKSEEVAYHLKVINFDIEDLHNLEDTGLLRVFESKSGKFIKFNHETYQEFYAAMAIIRGLLINRGDFFELVKNIVQDNCYNPKFDFVLSIASQFSVIGGQMVPGYKPKKDMAKFWRTLGEAGDILGAAAMRLFGNCKKDLTKENVEQIKNSLKDQYGSTIWIKFFNEATFGLKSDEESNNDGYKTAIIVNEKQEILDLEPDPKIRMSQYIVANTYKYYRSKGELDEDKVEELIQEAEKHLKEHDYWALDGGILAIGQTGKFFNKKLADYLIKRSNFWEDNQIKSIEALKNIYNSLNLSTDYEALNSVYLVISKLISIRYKSLEQEIKSLLYLVGEEFIEYLEKQLTKIHIPASLEAEKINDFYDPFNFLLLPYIVPIRNLLIASKFLQCAVIMKEKNIVFVKEKKTSIGKYLKTFTYQDEFLNMLQILLTRKDGQDPIEAFNQLVSEFKGCRKLDISYLNANQKLSEIIKRFCAEQFKETKLLKKYLTAIDNLKSHHDSKLDDLYKVMYNYGCIGPDIIEVINDLIREPEEGKNPAIFVKSRNNIVNNLVHIKLVGYTGIYFNNDLANFLIGKVEHKPYDRLDKPDEIKQALQNIKKTLTKYSARDDEWQNAVKAYNKVLTAHKKQLSGLKPIEEDIIPDQETSKKRKSLEEGTVETKKSKTRTDVILNPESNKKRKSLEEGTVETKKSTTEDNVDYVANAEKDHDYSEEEVHGMLGDQYEKSSEDKILCLPIAEEIKPANKKYFEEEIKKTSSKAKAEYTKLEEPKQFSVSIYKETREKFKDIEKKGKTAIKNLISEFKNDNKGKVKESFSELDFYNLLLTSSIVVKNYSLAQKTFMLAQKEKNYHVYNIFVHTNKLGLNPIFAALQSNDLENLKLLKKEVNNAKGKIVKKTFPPKDNSTLGRLAIVSPPSCVEDTPEELLEDLIFPLYEESTVLDAISSMGLLLNDSSSSSESEE